MRYLCGAFKLNGVCVGICLPILSWSCSKRKRFDDDFIQHLIACLIVFKFSVFEARASIDFDTTGAKTLLLYNKEIK